MKPTLFILAGLVLGLGLFILASTPDGAAAQDDVDPRIQELIDSLGDPYQVRPTETGLELAPPVEEEGGRASSAGEMPKANNPYNCRGRTDTIHISETGHANVHGVTFCPRSSPQPEIGAATQLHRWTCNPTCHWESFPPGSKTDHNKWRVWATSDGRCDDGRYMGISGHWIIDAEGDLYTASTSRITYITGCPY